MAKERLTSRQERFAQNVALRLMHWNDAAIDAGYAKQTVEKRGAAYFLDRPKMAQRIAELQQHGMRLVVQTLEQSFMQVGSMVTEALTVQRDLMRHAESESVKERAARAVIELGKGLLLSVRPKDSTYEEAMIHLFEEAQRRIKEKEAIEVESLADPD